VEAQRFPFPLLVGLLSLPANDDPVLRQRRAARRPVFCSAWLPTRDDGHCGGQFRGNSHPWSRHLHTLPAFIVARPITSAEILAVKFRAAAWSALLTWVMIVFALLAVLPFSHATTFSDPLGATVGRNSGRERLGPVGASSSCYCPG